MTIIILIYIFLVGLFIGSFINLLADRLPLDKPVIFARSKCDHCYKTLSVIELIPVLSFVIQKGRCRSCHKKISYQYPLVEILTGLGFVFIYLFLEKADLPSPALVSLLFLLTIVSGLIAVSAADIKYLIIPNEIVFVMSLTALLFTVFYYPDELILRILSALVASLFLFALFIATHGKGMGFGDVKLSVFMGLFLGFPDIVIAFYMSFLTGAAVGVILLLVGKVHLGKHIPFGPFLAISTLITFIWKVELINLINHFLF